MNTNTRAAQRIGVAAALLATLLVVSTSARADVTPFVDNYVTNSTANTSPATNAVVNLLNGYSQVWTPGTMWDNGTVTAAGLPTMQQNLQYVVDITHNRTQAQADYSYIMDRRHQSYSAIGGLGDLASAFRTASGAYTTISDTIPDAARAGKFDDKGNGAGLTTSELGKVVTLINTLRGDFTSTTPPKNYFKSPRPWRENGNGQVVNLGTETIGYYTSTNSDGTPNTAAAPTFFPKYDSNVLVHPSLLAARSTTPSSDGGTPSGHTNAAYLATYALAYAFPQRYDQLILNASAIGESRIITGMHSPVDVMAGRLQATALAGAILYKSTNATLKAEALAQAQNFFSADLNDDAILSQEQWVANKDLFTQRLTYGLSSIGDTTLAASVPKGAEALIESRFAYLDTEQRREVLRTTAIASGNVMDDAEGWNRLNLYAASGGYGRFDNDVAVNMDASLGGLSSCDFWRNDIAGAGGLVKQGSGTLVLTGECSYTGATKIQGGKLVVDGSLNSAVTVESGAALEGGGVFNQLVTVKDGGTLTPASSTITFANGLALADGSTLEFALGTVSDKIHVTGGSLFVPRRHGAVKVSITAAEGFAAGRYTLIKFRGAHACHLDRHDFELVGAIEGYRLELVRSHHAIELWVKALPQHGKPHHCPKKVSSLSTK